MKQPDITQVLLMAHGWGYNHHFFDAFAGQLPQDIRDSTLLVCLEAGYFPEQAKAGLMLYTGGEWLHHCAETLHSLVLAHAEVPWLGLGHSLGFSKLLDFSIRWHSLFSLHGFTHFIKGGHHTEGTHPRLLARMIQKAEQNMPEVLRDFHVRCGHGAQWATLNEHTLLADLRTMQQLDCSATLSGALAHGADLYAWAGNDDQIASLPLVRACFEPLLLSQGHPLVSLPVEHAGLAATPALYTDTLLPLLSQH